MWKTKMALAFFALISLTSINAADNLNNLKQILGALQQSTSESISFVQAFNLKEKSERLVRGGASRLSPFIQRFFENSRQGDAASARIQKPCDESARKQLGSSVSKSGLSPLEIDTARPSVSSLVNDLLLPYYQVLEFSPKQQNGLTFGSLKLPFNSNLTSSSKFKVLSLPKGSMFIVLEKSSQKPPNNSNSSSFMLPLFRKKNQFSVKQISKARSVFSASHATGQKNIEISKKALQSPSTEPHRDFSSVNESSQRDLVGNGSEKHESYAEAISAIGVPKKVGPPTQTAALGRSDIRIYSEDRIAESARRPAKQQQQHFPQSNRPDHFKKPQLQPRRTTGFRKSRPGVVQRFRNVPISATNHATVGRSKSSRKRVVSRKKLVRVLKRPVKTEVKALPDPGKYVCSSFCVST